MQDKIEKRIELKAPVSRSGAPSPITASSANGFE